MSVTFKRRCLWCLLDESSVTFNKKAHSIPQSLGGQDYNQNVCDSCNEYFGNRATKKDYSIEEVLKETFIISRQRLLIEPTKRKIGDFKSKFFEIIETNGIKRVLFKTSFSFQDSEQIELCRYFKRGLYKMFFEEFNRQRKYGYEAKYNLIRLFARYDIYNLPVIYFNRYFGVYFGTKREAETPTLFFERMNYLYSDEHFFEIEFLGHVFGFPITDFKPNDYYKYLRDSLNLKKGNFYGYSFIERLTDIDFTFSLFDK